MRSVPFTQVDVFSTEAFRGNPVAVVHLPDDTTLDQEQMAGFARWTNLSETTFLLPPTDPAADYRLRIFTPGGELPFAGHPTLGSCRAWLAAGGRPAAATGDGDRVGDGTVVVQECDAGLIQVRVTGDTLAFAAPPLTQTGPPEPRTRAAVVQALGLGEADVAAMEWVVNGPRWLGVLLRDAETVLALRPDLAALAAIGDLEVGVIGAYPSGPSAGAASSAPDYEVRAFCPGLGVGEDPVTGSLNAGLASWLVPAGLVPPAYVVSQGSVLRRAGRVHVSTTGGELWIGGAAQVRVSGRVDLGAA